VSFQESCVACGRCAAVCPGAAIGLSGWSVTPGIGDPSATRVRVACDRTPERLRGPGTQVCPCLGGLDEVRLLEMVLAAGGRPVELVDSGWCRTCIAGGREVPPGARARAKVSALLTDMGLPGLAPKLARQFAAGHSRDDSSDRRRARRRFLQRFSKPAVRPARAPHDTASRRRAELAVLARIAATHDAALPARAFPAVRASEACRDHAVCAAICPTGALGRYDAGGVRGLDFTAARCIACGACETICPEHAIAFEAEGDGRVPPDSVRLTAHESRVCARCDEAFAAASGDEDLCPACRKDAALFTDGFAFRPTGDGLACDGLTTES
jgi:Fe-S-cluster-containing hydrogenase component 2